MTTAITRREAMSRLAGAGAALLLGGAGELLAQPAPRRTRMGIVIYAMTIHQRNQWEGRHAGLSPAIAFLEESHRLGAGGIQCPLGPEDTAALSELRRRAEKYEMHVEASINPPRDQADSARFEQDVQNAQAAGASLARTVLFPGRRYENFKSVEEFRRAEAAALKSLQLAEPIIARRRFRLAVENHKDQRMPERLELLKRLSSEFIGLCVDVGNNFTLMEDPLDTVRAFAPWAFTVHFKDHAVREYEDGFLFSDVALGDGFLDLPALVKVLRDARKDVRFNLESITRDPLKVPVLTDTYWATLPETPPREFARTLRVVKANARSEPFPLVSKLTQAEQLELERRTVERSIAYARDKLSL